MSRGPRALLVALRDPHDPMLAHEAQCFIERARLPADHLDVHPMAEGRPTRRQLGRYDAVFFGGSGAYSVLDDVPWIREGLSALQDVLDAGKVAWASCFGFQGLARVLGGEVVRDDTLTEMGSTRLRLTEAGRSDPVVGILPADGFWAQEGHHDHVVTLPRGVILLATGDRVANQAFKVDGAPFYASQFHPELTVDHTVARFRHYQEHYLEDRDPSVLDELMNGLDCPEMAEVLPRLLEHC